MAVDIKEMREVYCEELIRLAKINPNIVVMDADLMKANGTANFKKEFPSRYVDVGVAEANMVGIAAGLATFGKIPFINSFATFSTRRCYDQLFISVAYSKLNVKIVGTDPGIAAELNGGTHMPFEDMGIMRNIPTMTLFEPTDATMLMAAMEEIVKIKSPVYIRLFRKKATTVYGEDLKFDFKRAIVIKDGKDAVIFCSGIMVANAIDAANILSSEGIDAAVVNIHTWKPIDKDTIIKYAKKTRAVVTAENHSIINGLGSAVCEVLSENYPVNVTRVGVKDVFGEVGKTDYLVKRFELTAQDIVEAVKKTVSKK